MLTSREHSFRSGDHRCQNYSNRNCRCLFYFAILTHLCCKLNYQVPLFRWFLLWDFEVGSHRRSPSYYSSDLQVNSFCHEHSFEEVVCMDWDFMRDLSELIVSCPSTWFNWGLISHSSNSISSFSSNDHRSDYHYLLMSYKLCPFLFFNSQIYIYY